jgi:hypothetical protein
LELILAVAVNSAALQDRDGAKLLLPGLLNFGWVRKVFADGGYAENSSSLSTPSRPGYDGWRSRQPGPRAEVGVMVCGKSQSCAELDPEIPAAAILRHDSGGIFLFHCSGWLLFTAGGFGAKQAPLTSARSPA